MDKKFKEYSRVGYLSTFFNIAVESYKNYVDVSNSIKELKKSGKVTVDVLNEEDNTEYEIELFIEEERINYLELELENNLIKGIIFIATFLESYIYNYSAIHLGDSFSKKHIDKLDLLSKWVIIPKLVSSFEIDKSRHYFENFKKLIAVRNKLIHCKTKKSNKNIENNEGSIPIYEAYDFKVFFEVIYELLRELESSNDNSPHLIIYKDELERILK